MSSIPTNNQAADFENLLIRSMPRLRKLAFSLTTSNSDSDDLVQHTLQRAIERQNQCLDWNNLEAWLSTILRSIWKNELRSCQVRRGNGIINSGELRATASDQHPEQTCARTNVLS